MRLAKARDYFRRLRERKADWPFRIERFTFDEIPTIGSGELVFSSPLTILAGPNGVGKTTLLRAIWAAAAAESARFEPSISMRFTSGKAELGYVLSGIERIAKVVFAAGSQTGEGQLESEIIHLDSSSETKRQQEYFCSFANVDDLTNGIGPLIADAVTIAEINHICRREYREMTLYEVEVDSGVVAPFFEVAVGNDRYDSRTMGAGELAILQLWWSIDRVDDGALVLIEEPETFLSPISQELLMQYLVASIVDKKLCVVITSHSPRIIGAVSEDNLVFLFRESGTLKTIEGLAPPALLEAIGIKITANAIALVEDELGELFLRQILERKHPRLSRRIEISVRGGEGNISALLKKVSAQLKHVRIIGVFDGDRRGKIEEEIKFGSVILPGTVSVEQLFKQLSQNFQSRLAAATGSDALGAILFSLQGEEEHNWFRKLYESLGLNQAQLFQIFFRIWESEATNITAMDEFTQEVVNLLTV